MISATATCTLVYCIKINYSGGVNTSMDNRMVNVYYNPSTNLSMTHPMQIHEVGGGGMRLGIPRVN